jgi:chemotaxis response regulator CheB
VRRILVVDDFQPWREAACELIEARPELQVIAQAQDGEEAVQLAFDLKPDLVVLDIGLPKLNGLTAAVRIFEASPETKIVFLSQVSDPDVVHAARSVGVCAETEGGNRPAKRHCDLSWFAEAREILYLSSMQPSSLHVLTSALDPN